MTIRLPEQDFRRLVDILSRNLNFQTQQDRLDFMRAAFFGSPREHDVLGNLDLSGTPNSAAVRVIIHLSEFGQDKPGRETLGVLVDRLLETMGGGKDEDSLNDLKRRYPFEARNAEPMPPEIKGDGPVPPPDSKPFNTGNAWAVLVGVNTYDDKDNYGGLRVCANDAEATREQLIAGGYNAERIRLLTDHTPDLLPTRNNILKTLKAVAEATEPDDLLLFYYSGHGDEAGDASYLVARDGQSTVLGDTAVAVSRVKQIVEEAPARAKVILLDACHSGANIGMKGPKPMSAAFIRRVFEQAEGMAILASCRQGQVSYEWPDKQKSVFTHYLLEALRGKADRDDKGFVSVQDVNRHVNDGVKLWASQRNHIQTPTLSYLVDGDIMLARYRKP